MKSLVTGCAGFIGSHLSEALLSAGHRVRGIDCFTDYYPRKTKERNSAGMRSDKNFDFAEMDVLDMQPEMLDGVDYVFHLAAQPGVRRSWQDFGAYVRNNIIATQHLLEICKESSLKRFIFASSSSVYGNAAAMNEAAATAPVSPYGVTKQACEQLCTLYASSGVPAVVLRYFSVYGPRQRPDMALSTFITRLRAGQAIALYGDGTQTRDLTFVRDAVDATLLAAEKDCTGETINVGSGHSIRMRDVITLLEELTGHQAAIEYRARQKGDAERTCADITKAQRLLGYAPSTELRAGLQLQLEAGV